MLNYINALFFVPIATFMVDNKQLYRITNISDYTTLYLLKLYKKQMILDISKYTNTTVYVTDLLSPVTLYYNQFIM